MATVTVSTNTNLSSLVYSAGDDIVIDSGAVLTMDGHITVNPLSMSCISNGKFAVSNPSTTTPIALTLSSNTGDFRFEKNGIFEVRGAMIPLTPGTGLASQSWSFASSPLDRVPYPSYVEVETSVGSGIYRPWMVVCTTGKTITFPTSKFSTGECGKVVFWNATTRTLSVGDGTNGQFLASGQNIRIPNIYFHSTVVAGIAARSIIDLNPAGTLDAECVGFSDAFNFSSTTFKSVRLIRAGFVFQVSLTASNGNVEIDGLSLSPDTQQNATTGGCFIASILGAVKLKSMTALMTGNAIGNVAAGGIGNNPVMTVVDNCKFVLAEARNAADARPIDFAKNPPALTRVNNLVIIGGRLQVSNCADLLFNGFLHADRLEATSVTGNATNVFHCVNSNAITVLNATNAGPAAARTAFCFADVNSFDIRFVDANYDGNSNLRSLIGNAWAGSQVFFYNSVFPNMAANSGPTQDSPATFLCERAYFFNTHATWTGTRSTEAAPFALENLVPGTPADYSTTFSAADGHNSALLSDSGLNSSTGSMVFAAFGPWTGYNTVTGAAQFDFAGLVELPGNGDTFEAVSQTYLSITSFINAAPVFSYTEGGTPVVNSTTPPATMTVQFAVRNPGGAWTVLAALDATNLSVALSALSGYDSDVGVQIKLLVTTTTADATRIFAKAYWTLNHDDTWVAADSTVLLSGPAATDITRLRRVSDNSVIATFVGSGTNEFYAAPNFDAQVYFERNDASDNPIASTRSTPQALTVGNNGTVLLYAGAQVQVAAGVTPLSDRQDRLLRIAASTTGGTTSGPVPGQAGTFAVDDPETGGGFITGTVDANGYRTAVTVL